MTKTLKQHLSQQTLIPIEDFNYLDEILEAIKEWLTQHKPLYKGTSGEYLLEKLIEELNQ